MIPAFVNAGAGSGGLAREVLEQSNAFDVRFVEPHKFSAVIREAVRDCPDRILVAGGDGTIASAATELVGTETALAVLPCGTLNHFARDHDLPTDLVEATRVATEGRVVTTDVAYAGERLFLNTSSVGAYVGYVRVRERLEQYFGYRVASIIAAWRMFFAVRSVHVTLEVEGTVRRYHTPLVFIGVGERELKAPLFGRCVIDGQRCLHLMVVRERRAARLITLALESALYGTDWIRHTPSVDSFLIDRCTIGVGRSDRHIALDGEIVRMHTPVEYRIARDALRIVVP